MKVLNMKILKLFLAGLLCISMVHADIKDFEDGSAKDTKVVSQDNLKMYRSKPVQDLVDWTMGLLKVVVRSSKPSLFSKPSPRTAFKLEGLQNFIQAIDKHDVTQVNLYGTGLQISYVDFVSYLTAFSRSNLTFDGSGYITSNFVDFVKTFHQQELERRNQESRRLSAEALAQVDRLRQQALAETARQAADRRKQKSAVTIQRFFRQKQASNRALQKAYDAEITRLAQERIDKQRALDLEQERLLQERLQALIQTAPRQDTSLALLPQALQGLQQKLKALENNLSDLKTNLSILKTRVTGRIGR